MTSQQPIQVVSGDRLDLMIGVFLEDCALQLLRPRTILNYKEFLGRYHWWCEAAHRSLEVDQHDRAHVRAFMTYLQQPGARWGDHERPMSSRPLSPRTQLHYFRVLSTFYNWLVREEYILASPMPAKPPRVNVEQPDPFTDLELSRLVIELTRGDDTHLTVRNRAIVAIMLDVALRASELVGIDVTDISPSTGDLTVTAAKGGRTRRVVLGALSRRAARRYWVRYRHMEDPSGPFFLNIYGERLTVSGLAQMTHDLGEAAGVAPCNPHRFRHTGAINAVRAGMNPFEVQAMLGHTDLTMTRRYVKLAEGDIREAARSHSPLDHLRLKL